MKKAILLPLVLMFSISITLVSCDEDGFNITPNDGLSNDEIIQGLKEALTKGTDTSVSILSIVDGYYKDAAVKILLPPEAAPIVDNIGKIPGGDLLLEETIKTINRSAEEAATEAKPIFVNAITGITITDGLNILQGNDSAATTYLKGNTYTDLQNAFQPKIATKLGTKLPGTNISAENSYTKLVDAYNTIAKIPFSGLDEIKENTLSEYTTKRALDGLFLKVAVEEGKIRKDPLHRVTDILKKVFSSLDK